ncbi:MAG TPA: N-acyl homoserine lactonase family protein [Xanthobacteraceae bacterium]|jgi:glyoxylase-like metal-dependent hydrolase (beta-lactamase superfamily II)|nr:N-acyl homoserine lactonase family protein [Xanthobacteraceae bacterium]
MTTHYEIFAIKYGHHPRPASDNFLGGDAHDVNMPLDYFVWAIVGGGRTIIVDTGFDEAVGTRRGRTTVKPVRAGLEAIGIDPDSVETVIMSHLHYDHSGNTELFPKARYHLQDCEMAYATGRCVCHKVIGHSFEPDYIVSMVRKNFAGRVEFHDGEGEVAPGVTVHHIGGHTKGLQCVRVETARGPVVIAADATHLYAHIDNNRVFPVVYNVAEVLEGYKTLKKLAGAPQRVVPGHDPDVLRRYPAAKAGLEGWVVRLDAEPRA